MSRGTTESVVGSKPPKKPYVRKKHPKKADTIRLEITLEEFDFWVQGNAWFAGDSYQQSYFQQMITRCKEIKSGAPKVRPLGWRDDRSEHDSRIDSADERLPYWQRSGFEYSLQACPGTARILLCRVADDEGLDYQGKPAPWQAIAKFDSYNDAERVLAVLAATRTTEPASTGDDS